ncbi:hypothetical protein SDC9_84385 [bioreactor metagenome]|uniref:Uncharacterized protein n=1 Tax=bioreactor metagenome TaxID=1076179 RepID=A0A644ZA54_9ZZZZ
MANASKSGRNRRIEKDILSEIQLGTKQYISLLDKIKHKKVTNLVFRRFTTAAPISNGAQNATACRTSKTHKKLNIILDK